MELAKITFKDRDIDQPTFWRWTTEALLSFSVLAGLFTVLKFFFRWGYLPQPFTYDTDGTFADWFNTAFWAHNDGAYDVWRSVYPPLAFVFLKVFSSGSCYEFNNLAYEIDCDLISKLSIAIFCGLNWFLICKILLREHGAFGIFRCSAFCLGFPILYVIERGNLIIPCFTMFLLGYGRVIRQAWLRWICVALTINFKPYLLLPALAYAIKRQWRRLEGIGFATLFVYLGTLAIMGSGDPLTVIENQKTWFNFVAPQYFWNIYASTSFTPFMSAIKYGPYPLLRWINSDIIDRFSIIVPIFIHVGEISVVIAIFAAWLRPGAVNAYRLSTLCLTLVLTASNPGGYAEVFLIFLVFLEPWKGWGTKIAIIASYLLCLPFDHIVFGVVGLQQESWLGNRLAYTNFGVSVGQFVRPALVLLIQYGLVISTVTAAMKGHVILGRSQNLMPAAEANEGV